jgi:hypothetical protein
LKFNDILWESVHEWRLCAGVPALFED